MVDTQALAQARQQLNELVEAARAGTIIPIRLPSQLEAIATLLDSASQGGGSPAVSAPATPGDDPGAMLDTAEFLKVAIHELRTPMTSIRGYSDMLGNPGMAGELTEMQAQLVQVIRANSKRMESLLSDMSYINKIRAGVIAVNNKIDMFKNIAMMVEKRLAPVVEELGRGLTFDIPQGLPILNTDGELMAHALVKLIENGLRYSPPETGAVTVTGSAEGNRLIITIEDNGIGMSADELARLGTMFFRADNDVVRSHKGSGLGLPIALGLIRSLGGTVSFASTPGQGTRVTLGFDGMT